MKRTATILLIVLLAAAVAGCRRHRIIPDDKLAMIFHDAFVTNAYIDREHVKTDSLMIYEPILEKYGYTSDDVYYTIGNFTKRKSARLSDVVERAITILEEEGRRYSQEVAVLDTIDAAARRHFTRYVLTDSLIKVHSLADTAAVHFTVGGIRPGTYRLTMTYKKDSLDKNDNIRGSMWLVRGDSMQQRRQQITYRNGREERISRTLTADGTHRTLHVALYEWTRKGDKRRRPHLTVEDLAIEYTPDTRLAVEDLYREQLNIRIFCDEFCRLFTQDSLPLSAAPAHDSI